MTSSIHPIVKMLRNDPRYKLGAYQFVRQALDFAHRELDMGCGHVADVGEEPPAAAHLTGQQLCEAIRRFAIEQFGYLAKPVLNSWGVHSTGDFGEIVYNLIEIEEMKKSDQDRREHFDDVFDFDEAFVRGFEIKLAPANSGELK